MRISLWNRLKRMLGLPYTVWSDPSDLAISPAEIMQLRAHIDEARNDPDYDVVWSYQADWTPADNFPASKP